MVEERVTQKFDFLGVHYDLKKKTRQNTAKTIEKIEILVAILRKKIDITRRGVTSIIGVYRYASEIIEYDLTDRFSELRQLANIIRQCAENIEEWDKPCMDVDYDAFIKWGKELLPNTPVPIKKKTKEGEKTVLITDASAEGWGDIMINKNKVCECHGVWKIRHSTEAEPKATEMALEALQGELSDRIVILTDHENLVHAMKSRAPKGYFYNTLKAYTNRVYKDSEIEVRFVSGLENPADGISRRKKLSEDDIEKSKRLYESVLEAGTGQNATHLLTNNLITRPSWMR